jgi:hypothetical protein
VDPGVGLEGVAGAGVGKDQRPVALFQEGQQRRLLHVFPMDPPLAAVELVLPPQLAGQAAGAAL